MQRGTKSGYAPVEMTTFWSDEILRFQERSAELQIPRLRSEAVTFLIFRALGSTNLFVFSVDFFAKPIKSQTLGMTRGARCFSWKDA